MVDLHIHTTKSDGIFTPEQIVDKAVDAGVKLFSVTDHDNMDANPIVIEKLKTLNNQIKFFTGTEISGTFMGKSLHLLCYDFDPNSSHIKEMFEQSKSLRKGRAINLLNHIKNNHGIVFSDSDIERLLGRGLVGKPHIADLALEVGLTDLNRDEFCTKYFDDCKYEKILKLDAKDVITATHNAGGFVSFAHPIEVQKEYGIGINELTEFTEALKDQKLDAIEVYHSSHGENEISNYKQIAKRFNLLKTAGSDFHGTHPNRKIGRVSKDSMIVCDEIIEQF